jgi:uncharacterized integral membrane protein
MKAKIITIMILVVLFTIFVSQNTSVVKINAFFWTFEMSAIVLISLTGLVGVILGFILSSIFNKQKKMVKTDKKANEEPNKGNLKQGKEVKTGI